MSSQKPDEKPGHGLFEHAGATLIVFVLPAAVLWWICSGVMTPDPERQAATEARWDAEQQQQDARRALVSDLVDQGVFDRVSFRERGATVVVGPNFYALRHDEKQQFTAVVWAVTATQARSEYVVVTLTDVRSGRKVGEHAADGLRMQ